MFLPLVLRQTYSLLLSLNGKPLGQTERCFSTFRYWLAREVGTHLLVCWCYHYIDIIVIVYQLYIFKRHIKEFLNIFLISSAIDIFSSLIFNVFSVVTRFFTNHLLEKKTN